MSPFLVVWECWIGWCWLPTTKEGFTVIHVTIKAFWGYWIEGAHGALVALSTSVEGHSTTTRLVKCIKEIHNISCKKHKKGLLTIHVAISGCLRMLDRVMLAAHSKRGIYSNSCHHQGYLRILDRGSSRSFSCTLNIGRRALNYYQTSKMHQRNS